MTEIIDVKAREILDSRGNPTVEVEMMLACGAIGRAAVPSGASTGKREALELRNTRAKRYGGKGVVTAVKNANTIIADEIRGMDAADQLALDTCMLTLDGTANKSKLGANAILGVSMAAARAAANAFGLPLFRYLGGVNARILPIPMMNVINGGAHAANNLDIQEFMIVPFGAKTMAQAIQMGAETFHALKTILKKKGLSTAVGDEGGFAPDLKTNEEALDVHYGRPSRQPATQPAKTSAWPWMWRPANCMPRKKYVLKGENKSLSAEETGRLLSNDLVEKYPILSIEDGLAEQDWDNWIRD
jgi:enolase